MHFQHFLLQPEQAEQRVITGRRFPLKIVTQLVLRIFLTNLETDEILCVATTNSVSVLDFQNRHPLAKLQLLSDADVKTLETQDAFFVPKARESIFAPSSFTNYEISVVARIATVELLSKNLFKLKSRFYAKFLLERKKTGTF